MTKEMYDESPNDRERDSKLRSDLAKLNNSAFLVSEYTAIYKKLMKRKDMTDMKAHALATCELIKKNNVRLQILLEDWTGRKFPD